MSKWTPAELAWLASTEGRTIADLMRKSEVEHIVEDVSERDYDRVDARAVREQVAHWYEMGYSMQQIGKAIGYSPRSLSDVRRGKRTKVRRVLIGQVDAAAAIGLSAIAGEPEGKKYRAREGASK